MPNERTRAKNASPTERAAQHGRDTRDRTSTENTPPRTTTAAWTGGCSAHTPRPVAPSLSAADNSTARPIADGGTAPADLTAFQTQILIALAEAGADGEYGLAIKRDLEAVYGSEVNHGRLYPNLDELAERGLLEKREIDKRTNGYQLTSEGVRVLETRLDRLSRAIDAYHEDSTADGEADNGSEAERTTDAAVPDGGDRR